MRRLRAFGLLALGLLVGCWWQSTKGARARDETMELYGLFVDAVEKVEANYARPVTRRELVENALRGMLTQLDPHSNYLDSAAWRSFQKQVEGSYSGLGIQVDIDPATGRPVVVAPLIGSPAYQAGVAAGDVILEVNGESTEGFTLDQLGDRLAGPAGGEVTLKVSHPGGDAPRELKVRRARVEIESVVGDRRDDADRWNFMLDDARKIGYVRITGFVPETAADLAEALASLDRQGVKGLILDLRDDPGGLLSSAVEVADMFLDSGKIVSVRGRNISPRTFVAEQQPTDRDAEHLPIVVLINRHSASAAEVLAAALQDQGRAKIVGERSFGKASVQNMIALEGGEARLKLTVGSYFRPSGKDIHRAKGDKPSDVWGVNPDEGLEVKLDDTEYLQWWRQRQSRDRLSRANRPGEKAGAESVEDRQLDKALEVMRATLGANS